MEQLYDIETAAGLLCISPWTLRSYIAKGRLRSVRIGRRVLLQDAELKKLLVQGKQNGNSKETECQTK